MCVTMHQLHFDMLALYLEIVLVTIKMELIIGYTDMYIPVMSESRNLIT